MESLVRRWAVKEATYKAFQRYRVLFPEIRLTTQHSETSSSSDVELAANPFVPPPRVHTKLPIAETSHALRLEFCGETEALAKQLLLMVRIPATSLLPCSVLLMVFLLLLCW